MGGKVDDGGLDALGGQVLRYLQADEAAAGHHRLPDLPGLHRRPQGDGVVGGAHDEDVLHVQPRHVRHEGGSPGGDDQLVIAILRRLAGSEVPGLHNMPVRVDGYGLGFHLHPGPCEGGEFLRRIDDQLAFFMDHIAYVIGQAAAGVGDVLSLGQNRHLAGAVLPLEFGGGFGPRGYAAQYQHFHGCLSFFLPIFRDARYTVPRPAPRCGGRSCPCRNSSARYTPSPEVALLSYPILPGLSTGNRHEICL